MQNNNAANNNIIDINGIVSFKMFNCVNQVKDVKKKEDRTKIVNLINSVKISKKIYDGVLDGVGYGVMITYDDGREEVISFGISKMNLHRVEYEIDKNIYDDIGDIYRSIK